MQSVTPPLSNREPAERDARESEIHFRSVADHAPVMIWVTEPDGRCSYLSRSWYEFTGQNPATGLGFGWLDVTHPDDRPAAEKAFGDANQTHAAFRLDYRLRRHDGVYRWAIDSASPRFGADGEFLGYVGSVIDITERQEKENETRRSEERYRALVENQMEMLCRFSSDGTILFVNGAYARSRGTTPETLRGENFWRFIPEEGREAVRAMLDGLTPGSPEKTIENRFETAEGPRWTRWTNRAIAFDEQGRWTEAQSTGFDITDRKRAEEALRQSEARLRLFIEHAPAALAMFDRQMRYLAVTQRWKEDYGLSGDLVGRSHYEVFPDLSPTWKAVHARGLAGEVLRADEDPFRSQDGTMQYVKWEVRPWSTAEGEVGGILIASENVTLRKRAEDALRQTKERFDIVKDSTQVGFWFCDLPFDKLVWDNRVKEHFWLPPDTDVTIEMFYSRLHPDDRSRTQAAIEASIAKKAPYEIEFRTVSPDAHVRWIRAMGRGFYDSNGRPIRFDGVSLDITTRRQAEEQLRRNHETFFNLIQNAPFGVYVIDAEFHLRQVSFGAQKVFSGISPLLGRDFADVLREVWKDPFASEAIAIFRRTLATGEAYRSPSTVETRAGKEVVESYDWRIERITLPDGQFGIVCYFYDLSERRQAEENLRLHRELLETVVHHLEIGVALVRGADLRYQIVNESYQAISLGRRFLGQTVEEAWPELRPHFGERCRHVLETGVPYAVVDEAFQIRRVPDGPFDESYFSWSIHRVRLPGEDGWGLLLSVTDTTGRKKVENALRDAHALLTDKATHLESLVQQRTLRLRETIAELEAFSYSIAHDMRAPLRSMQGFSDALLSDYAEKLDAEGASYLRRISKSAGRMDKLIQDVLSYSRVVRGEWPAEPVEVEHLLHGIADTYPTLAPEKADLFLEGEFPPVLGSEAMLMQIFSNLLGNAVKFVPPGTKPQVRVWAEPRDRRVRLFIRDNGIGIAPEEHQKIFGIFHQAGKGYEGTGIGLAIVKKAVERMGGSVGVESSLGQGTTFWVDVPRA